MERINNSLVEMLSGELCQLDLDLSNIQDKRLRKMISIERSLVLSQLTLLSSTDIVNASLQNQI